MSIDTFTNLAENDTDQIDKTVMEYLHSSYYQHRPPRAPLLHTLRKRWRTYAMMCVCDSMWEIDWPYEEHRISVKPHQVPYLLVVDDFGSEEKANRFIEVTVAVQVWLPSSKAEYDNWAEDRSFPWVHSYVRDVLAYQWATKQVEKDDHYSMRHAYKVLGNLPARPKTITYLEEGLQHPNLYLRRDAIKPAIKKMGDRTVPFLIESMNEDNMHLKDASIEALGQFPGPETVEALLAQFDMELAPYVRSTLVKVLGKMGDKRAIEPLTALLQDSTEYDWFRGEAAISLALLGPQTYDILQPYLEDDTLREKQKKVVFKILNEN